MKINNDIRKRSIVALLLAILMLVVCFALLLDYIGRATILDINPIGFWNRLKDLVVLFLFILSAGVLGKNSLRLFKLDPQSLLYTNLLSYALGFIWFYIAGLLLAIFQIVFTWLLWIIVVLPILSFWRDALHQIKDLWSLQNRQIRAGIFSITAVSISVLYLIMTLSPPTWIDPLTYHLVIPAEYLAHGGVPNDNGNIFSVFPPAMSILYMFLMGMGSDMLPKLLHAFFLALIILVCYDRMRRWTSSGIARYAVLFFAAQWSVQHAVQRANVDFHFAFYGLLSFMILVDAVEKIKHRPTLSRWLIISGAFLGAAVSSKVHSISCLGATELLFIFLLFTRRIYFKGIVLFHISALLVYFPTLLRNLLCTGDPIALTFPGFVQYVFRMDPIEIVRFQAMAELKGLFMTDLTWITFILTPLFAYLDGWYPSTNFDAFIDPFYLISLILGLLFIKRNRLFQSLYVYLFGFYIVWLTSAGLARYALPILPLLCFLTVNVFFTLTEGCSVRIKLNLQKGFKVLIICFVSVSALNMAIQKGPFLKNNLTGFFELVSREMFYADTRPGTLNTLYMGRFLDDLEDSRSEKPAPDAAKVFMVFASQSYYLNRPYYNDPFYVNLILLRDIEEGGQDPLDWLKKRGYRYVLTDFARVPWLKNPAKKNPHLNPYPDALKKLDAILDYWEKKIKPGLKYHTRIGRLELYEIPQ